MSNFVTNIPSPAIDVRFKSVTKRYGDAAAVKELTLDIPRGSFFSLLGPSGCGTGATRPRSARCSATPSLIRAR